MAPRRPVRPGGQRHRVVHCPDEHAAARHQQRRPANEGHAGRTAAHRNGELMRFDRVLANPPFSINWGTPTPTGTGSPSGAKFPPSASATVRCLGKSKKADLMFLQHMLAVLRDGRMVATVMPHGVLFRGGEEAHHSRRHDRRRPAGSRDRRRPNLFYGTGIPACMLVMRSRQRWPAAAASRRAPGQGAVHQRRPRILEGRAQNHLLPEHIEKIVTTFEIPLPSTAFGPRQTTPRLRQRLQPQHPPLCRTTPRPSRTMRATCWAACPKAEVQAKAALFPRKV